ncbi:MAG TPA: hypothetical protein VMI75_15085 [Polyangiaceae bacterium]|nr:hypothetical protein [Polyangiaceae bacterium]
MPKRGKLEKRERNRSMIRGIRKHRAVFAKVPVGPERLDADGLIARFEEHTQVVEEIDDYESKKRDAVARERRMEPGIRQLRELVLHAIRAFYGAETIETESFGVKAKRPPRLPIATKAAAVAKRKATRKARGTMGPKQRKRIKGY